MFDDGDAASHLWLEPTMSGKGSRHRYYPEPPSAILQLPTTHTHLFSGPFSRTTRVSRYQKGKPIWILLKQETVSGSGISWAMCKSAPRPRQYGLLSCNCNCNWGICITPPTGKARAHHKAIISLYTAVHRLNGTERFPVDDEKRWSIAAASAVGSLFHACSVATEKALLPIHWCVCGTIRLPVQIALTHRRLMSSSPIYTVAYVREVLAILQKLQGTSKLVSLEYDGDIFEFDRKFISVYSFAL